MILGSLTAKCLNDGLYMTVIGVSAFGQRLEIIDQRKAQIVRPLYPRGGRLQNQPQRKNQHESDGSSITHSNIEHHL